MHDKDNPPIRSLKTASEIIGLLLEKQPLGPTEIASELGIAQSTAHDYLKSLYQLDHLVKQNGQYRLGLQFLNYGIAARSEYPIAQVGVETAEQLAEDTDEAVWIIVEEHGQAVYVHSASGARAVRTHAQIGTHSELHCIASGKSILAHLTDERVEEIIEKRGLEKKADNTINRREELYGALAEIHERGYAFNDNEAVNGSRSVGAPVIVGDEIYGAISISGPAKRLPTSRIEDDLVPDLLAATNEVELKLAQNLSEQAQSR